MKTVPFFLRVARLVLPVLVVGWLMPTAGAQQITVKFPDPSSKVENPLVACYDGCLTFAFDSRTNNSSGFHTASSQSVSYAGLQVTNVARQDATISTTAAGLTITGKVEVSCFAANSQVAASAIWDGIESSLVLAFSSDHPMAYSIQATTDFITSPLEYSAIAMTGLSSGGYSGVHLPDLVAFGRLAIPSAAETAPTASGTANGILPAGTYYFEARAHSASYVDPGHPDASEHFLAAFDLNVTNVPPQPPLITGLSASEANGFNLVWTAFQSGRYRVLASPDLGAWSEWVPAAVAPSGLNTNAVSAAIGPRTGFYRVEYLP